MLPIEKRINYQILGNDTSPKLVFLHGIMGQGRNWSSIAKKFSKNFQCLIYDQRGHGKSSDPGDGVQLGDFARDLGELLDFLGWTEPIYLVGHSMGGRVALYFTDHNPERVKKLVIVDIGASANWDSMAGIIKQLEFVPVPFESRNQARSFMENEFLARYPNKMVMEFFYSSLVEEGGKMDWIFSKTLIRQSLEMARHKDYWAEFKNLPMPTLYIRGGESKHLKESEFVQVLQNNPNIQKAMEILKTISDFFNIEGRAQG